MEYVIFNQNYLDIPLQDMPDAGNFIVCHDPQNRLGIPTWSVVRANSDQGGYPPKPLGLFWDKEQAELFAEALIM